MHQSHASLVNSSQFFPLQRKSFKWSGVTHNLAKLEHLIRSKKGAAYSICIQLHFHKRKYQLRMGEIMHVILKPAKMRISQTKNNFVSHKNKLTN